MEECVSQEVAEAEFERFVEAMEIDLDTTGLDEEEIRDTQQDKTRIVRAIKNGRVTVNEGGLIAFVPRTDGAGPIIFHAPTGAALAAMDKKKGHHDVGKMYSSMASITRTSEATFSKMEMPDLKVCMAIWTLFLA